jgi:muramoyltetrapeptide carboxypeptidase
LSPSQAGSGLGAAPPRVRLGDQIAVIAPSGPPPAQTLVRGVHALASAFRVRVAPAAAAPERPSFAPYLAADDERRASETNAMLADPDVRAVIMARGGYGLMRILPLLDPALLRADPKPIVAFSDGTALLSWALRAGVRGVHGQVVVRIGEDRPETLGDLVRALTDPTPLGRLDWPLRGRTAAPHRGASGPAAPTEPSPAAPPRGDPARAALVTAMLPCNLVMACHLIGTPWQLPHRDAAWWLEEVGERPYELDRALTHLELTGCLREVRAVVVGDLQHCMDSPTQAAGVDDPRAALAVVEERLQHAGVPYLVGGLFGHGRYNPPLPFGGRCRIDADAATLEILDGAVA